MLKPLDLAVIAIYIVVLIGLGMWVSFRRKGTQEDIFLGGRSFGWVNVGFSLFGTNISPGFLISCSSLAYATGMVAANFEWLAWVFLMILAMFFVPYYLNTKISTMPQFMKHRFGNGAHTFLAWYALFTTIVMWLGGILYVGGVLFSQIMGWPLWVSVLFLVFVSTSFTVIGGLAAVIITDTFQSILIIVGTCVLVFVGLREVGGVSALVTGVPADYWQLFRPASDEQFPWHAIVLGYPVMAIWFWCIDQTIVQRVLGAKDLRNAQLGAVFTGFLKILPPFLFLLPGIICRVLHPDLEDPDWAFTTMVTNYLPAGLVGLVIAVFTASLISTIDSGLNSASTLFTLDIYQAKLRPAAGENEVRWVGRAATISAAILSIAFALLRDTFDTDLFNIAQSMMAWAAPPLAAVFVVGVLWKRATAAGALVMLIVGTISSWTTGLLNMYDIPYDGFWPHYLMVGFYQFVFCCTLI